MFNWVPVIAMGLVGIGYSGAISALDRAEATSVPDTTIVSFSAAPNLSVHDFVGQLPGSVQDPLCDAKQTITASLQHDFAEVFESTWEQQHRVSMELWASDLMGTWTLLRVETDALACIVASGFGWSEGMDAQDILSDRPLS